MDRQVCASYPGGTTAGASARLWKFEAEGESWTASSRLQLSQQDFKGLVGIEGGFDAQLRGHAGTDPSSSTPCLTAVVNVWQPPEPGKNVVLTIALDLQRAAKSALTRRGATRARKSCRDVRNGECWRWFRAAINPDYSAKIRTAGQDTNLLVKAQ